MKKQLICYLLATIVSTAVYGQTANKECDPTKLAELPGNWKKGMEGSPSRSPETEQARAKKITDAIHQLLTKNYIPKGVQASYSATKPYPSQSKSYEVSDYYYAISFLCYYCDGNTINTAHETGTSVDISANQTNIFFTHNVTDVYLGDDFKKEHYGWLDRRPVLENGAWSLGSTQGKDAFGVILKRSNWIIAYNDKEPFVYVSRKEYLEALKAKLSLAKEINSESIRSSAYIRPKAEQDAEKEKIIDEYSKTEGGRNWLKRYLADYKTDEEKLAEKIKNSNSSSDEKINLVEKNLKMPAEELANNAVISSASDFQGFLQENDRYARYIVKENPDYYNTKLASAVPQLFGIEFTVEIENPVQVQAYKDVMKALDFAVLKNMLGK